MIRYVGIDPGNKGAIALLEHENSIHKIVKCLDMPIMQEQVKKGCKVRTEPDFDEMLIIFDEILKFAPDVVFLEQLWAQLDSAMTAFSLGGSYKMLRALLHAHGFCFGSDVKTRHYNLIAPAQWKRWKPYQKWGLWGAGCDSKAIAIDMFNGIFPGDNTELLCPLRKGSTTRRNKPADGRADAALIGLFGACELMGLPLPKTLEHELALVGADGRCNLF